MEPITVNWEGYTITTDKSLLLPREVHQWLAERSYWCKGIPYATFFTTYEHSHCIGVLHEGRQVAFARLVTDYAVFAYLADVYVREEYRGQGISKQMLQVLLGQEWLKGLRRLMLATVDAHGLYRQFGFSEPGYPERLMEIARPGLYNQQATTD